MKHMERQMEQQAAQMAVQAAQMAALLKSLGPVDGGKAEPAQVRGGRQALVHAQVAGGVDYVQLAGPTPAEAAAATTGQTRRRRQQQQTAAAAVAPAWTPAGGSSTR